MTNADGGSGVVSAWFTSGEHNMVKHGLMWMADWID